MRQTVCRPIITMIAMASLLGATTAQLQAQERVVTLREVMAIAKENNGELKALREESGLGEAGKIKAGLFPNPLLDLEGATGALTGSSSENRLSIGLSQEFLTGGKREKRLAVAESELARFGGEVRDAERLLLLELKSGYYDLLLAEGRLELAQKFLDLNGQLLHVTQERFAAGDVAELDVNLAKVENARSELRKIEAERDLFQSRMRLLSLTGMTSPDGFRISAPPELNQFETNLAELKALALKNRPDLQAVAAEKSKGEAELALAEAERLPNVTAGIALSRESTVASFGGLDDRSTDYLLGLKLSVPLQFFDRNQAGLKEAQVRKSRAEIRHSFARLSLEREVEAAHGRLTVAQKALGLYAREIIPQLTENLKLVQEAYRLGETGILPLIEEQKKFIEVNEGYLSARYSRNIALAKLEAAVGIELNDIAGGRK